MPKHPMPVPPIVQPEVCARAIRFAAEHPRRNSWVGVSTAYTVLGNRVAPALADWYLAKTGVSSQQTDQDVPRWGSNVFEPQDENQDRGARGGFSGKAAESDAVSFLGRHRWAAGMATAATAAATAVVVARRSS